MTHPGKEGLGLDTHNLDAFTQYVSESKRDNFITHFVETYLERVPLDQSGLAHVRMVRLEVSALKS